MSSALLIPPWEKGSARVPEGIRLYVVGDVHGRADFVEAVSYRIDAHSRAYPVRRAIQVFLGDYIDRGSGIAGSDGQTDPTLRSSGMLFV